MNNSKPERDDAQVLRQCVAGDRLAFRTLVNRYQETAFRFALRLTCDPHEAQDLSQEAFIRVWRYRQKLRPDAAFGTLLYTILSRLWIDQLRRRKRWISHKAEELCSEILPQSGLSIESAFINQETAARIRRLSLGLPGKQRLVFTLRDLEGLNLQEVQEITGLSLGSIKTNLSYARQKLRSKLQETGSHR